MIFVPYSITYLSQEDVLESKYDPEEHVPFDDTQMVGLVVDNVSVEEQDVQAAVELVFACSSHVSHPKGQAVKVLGGTIYKYG